MPRAAPGWTTALLLLATGCGGLLAPIGSGEGDGGTSPEDASSPDAPADVMPGDERGLAPVPVCTGKLSQCLAPEAGVTWTGAAVITCQPEEYVGPWTLVLERQVNNNFLMVQTQVVQEPGFGATFYDTTAPPRYVTYRVCVEDTATTGRCGNSFTTYGTPGCGCEPTSCGLLGVCNTTADDGCGSQLDCGDCVNGNTCQPDHTCCGPGLMPDGWGNCVCAPPPGCSIFAWDTTTCMCCPGGP